MERSLTASLGDGLGAALGEADGPLALLIDTFEELEAQCQSDFEREVLAAIRDRGLPPSDEVQKTVYEGDEPIATADFLYALRILFFVDSSPHYRDYIAAADDTKQKRLKAKRYRIVAIKDIEAELEGLITKLGV